jgi:hypothetical protein
MSQPIECRRPLLLLGIAIVTLKIHRGQKVTAQGMKQFQDQSWLLM